MYTLVLNVHLEHTQGSGLETLEPSCTLSMTTISKVVLPANNESLCVLLQT